MTKDLDGPLDDCKDLDKDQIENLNGWIERFDEKVRSMSGSAPFIRNADIRDLVSCCWQARGI